MRSGIRFTEGDKRHFALGVNNLNVLQIVVLGVHLKLQKSEVINNEEFTPKEKKLQLSFNYS